MWQMLHHHSSTLTLIISKPLWHGYITDKTRNNMQSSIFFNIHVWEISCDNCAQPHLSVTSWRATPPDKLWPCKTAFRWYQVWMTAKGLICSPCILFVYQEDRVISWVEEKWSMTDRAMETSFSCAPQIAFRSMHNSSHIPLPKGMSKTPGNLTPCSEYSRKNGMKICLLMYDLTKLKKMLKP